VASRPPAHQIYAGRYLVPRTFALARRARVLSAVDLDDGAPVLLVPLLRAADAVSPCDAVERWNRAAPNGSPRALTIARHGATALLVADGSIRPRPVLVRTPHERMRLRSEAAAIGASLDAAGLTLPEASLVDLALTGEKLCMAHPAVPGDGGERPLTTLLPLLIGDPPADAGEGRARVSGVRIPAARVRVRPLTLAAAVAVSAIGYVVVGAALPQRGGVEPAIAARALVANEAASRPPPSPPVAAEPVPRRPPRARGGRAQPVVNPPQRLRPARRARAAPPAANPAPPVPIATPAAASPARASRPPPAPTLPTPTPALAPPAELPLAPALAS